MSNPIVDAFYCNLVRYDPDAEMNRCVECGQIVESPTDHDGGCPVAAVHALVWGPAVPTVESLVAESARLTLAVTNAKLEFDAIWRAVQVGSGHDDAAAANEAGRVAENASRMMARALKGDD